MFDAFRWAQLKAKAKGERRVVTNGLISFVKSATLHSQHEYLNRISVLRLFLVSWPDKCKKLENILLWYADQNYLSRAQFEGELIGIESVDICVRLRSEINEVALSIFVFRYNQYEWTQIRREKGLFPGLGSSKFECQTNDHHQLTDRESFKHDIQNGQGKSDEPQALDGRILFVHQSMTPLRNRI
jgi:hypothetical protein